MKNKVSLSGILTTIGILCFWAGQALAAPNIESVSGDLEHGQSYSITGSGFGIKSPVEPFRYGDFEDGEVGQRLKSQAEGGWETLGYYPSSYSILRQRIPGQKVAQQRFEYVEGGGGWASGMGLQNISSRTYYVSGWMNRWDHQGLAMNNNNAKAWAHFYRHNQPYPQLRNGNNPQLSLGCYMYTSDMNFQGAHDSCDNPAWFNEFDNWTRVEQYLDSGTVGNYDGFAWFAQDGVIHSRIDNDLILADGNGFDYFEFNYYFGVGNNASMMSFTDDLYVDTTQARIELGNAPVFENCTHREIQIPEDIWNDGNIGFKANLGSFSAHDQLYLFVVDENGNASEGYPVSANSFLTVCGDDFVSGSEKCDGANINMTCQGLGYDSGNLGCHAPGTANECTFDVSSCSPSGVIAVDDRDYFNFREDPSPQSTDWDRKINSLAFGGTHVFSLRGDDQPGGWEQFWVELYKTLTPGLYNVDVRWINQDPAHLTLNQYVVYHAGGETLVPMHQSLGEGVWHRLGQFTFGSEGRVRLLNDGLINVSIDAVRFIPVGQPPPVNHAPVLQPINNQQVNEGASLNVPLSSTDPDAGDRLTLSWSSVPDVSGFGVLYDNGNGTGELEFIPGFDRSGTYSITVRVLDDGNPPMSDSKTFNLVVNNINQPPVVSAVNDQVIDENQVRIIPITITDPDGDAIAMAVDELDNSFITVNHVDGPNYNVVISPDFTQAGTYSNIRIKAVDNGTPPATGYSQSFTVTVNNVNRVPVLSAVGDQTVNEGEVRTVPITITDADADTIIAFGDQPDLAFITVNHVSGNNYNVVIAPDFTQSGSYPNNRIFATDSGNPPLTGYSLPFTVTVNDVVQNHAPVIVPIDDQAMDESQTLVVPIAASDADCPDGSCIALTWSNPISFGTFVDNHNGTGTLTFTPGYSDAGTYPTAVSVSDGIAPPVSENFTLEVNNVNQPPQITPIDDKVVNEGELLEFTISVSDPDLEDQINLSALPMPEGASLTPSGNREWLFSWTPDYEQAGDYNIVFTAFDNGGLSDTEDVGITVIDVDNVPPVISNVFSYARFTTAVITWETNEPTTSQVEYGLTNQYGSLTPIDTRLVRKHKVLLTGLTPGTVYHFRVRSKDGAENEAISGDYNFRTIGLTPGTLLSLKTQGKKLGR